MDITLADRIRFLAKALIPVVLLGIFILVFLKFGPLGVFKGSVPPIEKIFIQKVSFAPEFIELRVINDGPQPVTIAQVLVNEALWQFTMTPTATLKPLEKGTISLHYPWNAGDPLHFTMIASDGVTFEKEVGVAFNTPRFNLLYLKSFILLGIYVGVIPVLLGLIWFPFLKRLRGKGYLFLLSLTVGLLLFLGIDAVEESFELLDDIPESYNGIGIFLIGLLLAILTLSAVSYKTEHHLLSKGEDFRNLIWGYLIALGIGLHNLGEGLAIGSAYAIGEIALGAALVLGFMIHNVTEGIAIVAPLTNTIKKIENITMHLLLMGIIAGAPTIIGTLVGGFSYSSTLAIFFLSIGAGAIFDVTFDILAYIAKSNWKSIYTPTNVSGFLFGLVIMYLTSVLVFA